MFRSLRSCTRVSVSLLFLFSGKACALALFISCAHKDTSAFFDCLCTRASNSLLFLLSGKRARSLYFMCAQRHECVFRLFVYACEQFFAVLLSGKHARPLYLLNVRTEKRMRFSSVSLRA